ncbi:MAG: DUF202 domain-containing protein [Mycobacterium sp.]|nr:DUF202 domain-containing protein [Mycobacterium sp.]
MTIGGVHGPPDGGLQAERTSLSWGRTSLAMLANGGVLLLKEFGQAGHPLRLAAAGLAVVIALGTYLIGTRRQAVLRKWPLPATVTATREVHLVGAAVLLLMVVSVIAVLV